MTGVNEPGLPVGHLVSSLEPLVTAMSQDGVTGTVSTVAMVDPADIRSQAELRQPVLPDVDLVIMVGVTDGLAVEWLESLLELPVALMVKQDVVGPRLRSVAAAHSVAVIEVDARARWDMLLSRIRRMLDDAVVNTGEKRAGPSWASVATLSDLANLIADGVHGMVTIENRTNRVLAYSPSESTADELRTRAILGRAAPPEVMEIFRRLGVVQTLAGTADVVSLPADPAIGMRRRLVTGIHGPDGEPLGSVWVQQGEREFSADAETLLRGGAVSAAALMMQAGASASSAEEVMVRRLLGEESGVDGRTAATLLRLPLERDYAVIGFAARESGSDAVPEAMRYLIQRLQLHVRAYAPAGVVGVVGPRAYALVPELSGGDRVFSWVTQLLNRFDEVERIDTSGIRGAIAMSVDGLDGVSAARGEVDRVLDSPAAHSRRVTSLTQSRTSVLLGEVFDLLAAHPELQDPRVAAVADYDERHGASLVVSLEAYLRAGMNVRDAAAMLTVHPNTLRYRVERAQQLSGLDLRDPGDRLLTELQLGFRG
ncbi:MAG: PucR family transcriptional regulator [Corynebacterium sp.]|uniref:PucR family transcriptional regulator n=1 Tax=Corynebacterium sp. TaxID=1720 RepID=UPI003F09538C